MSSEYGLDGCGMANIKEMAIASCFMENLKISINVKQKKQMLAVNVNKECYYNETKRLCNEES